MAGHGRAKKCADQIGDGRQHDRLARRQHLGGNHGGDGIGRVVKTVDVGEHQGDEDDEQDEGHRASGIFQDDLHDDVAGVVAAVNDLFHQFINIADGHGAEGFVFAAVKFAQQFVHVFVRLGLDELEPVIERLDLFQVLHVAQLLDHLMDRVGGLGHHVGLLGEINAVQMVSRHHEAFGQFLGGLGNPVKSRAPTPRCPRVPGR